MGRTYEIPIIDFDICDGVSLENDVVVGDRLPVKCGARLWDSILGEDAFIGT